MSQLNSPKRSGRQGVIAVVTSDENFLVIKRSRFVSAPGRICFPGGGIEKGETEPMALVREMQEELRVDTNPMRRLWRNYTPSGVELFWWKTEIISGQLDPNPDEVEHFEWMTFEQILVCDGLLETNREFMSAWKQNGFEL